MVIDAQSVSTLYQTHLEHDTVSLPYDIVLLTDCVFSASLIKDLIRTIKAASHKRTTVVVVHEIRDIEANDAFVRQLSVYFNIKTIPKAKQHPEYRHELVQILIAKMKTPREMTKRDHQTTEKENEEEEEEEEEEGGGGGGEYREPDEWGSIPPVISTPNAPTILAEPDFVDMATICNTIKCDVKYATTDNFTGE